jgi:hypothetical protein
MKKNIAIGVLLATVAYLSYALVRVENQRYALQVGMCRDVGTGFIKYECLSKVETRTNSLWHLYYALKG